MAVEQRALDSVAEPWEASISLLPARFGHGFEMILDSKRSDRQPQDDQRPLPALGAEVAGRVCSCFHLFSIVRQQFKPNVEASGCQ